MIRGCSGVDLSIPPGAGESNVQEVPADRAGVVLGPSQGDPRGDQGAPLGLGLARGRVGSALPVGWPELPLLPLVPEEHWLY